MRVNWDSELEKVAQARAAAGEIPGPQPARVLPETVIFQPAQIQPPPTHRVRIILLIAAAALLAAWLLFSARKAA